MTGTRGPADPFAPHVVLVRQDGTVLVSVRGDVDMATVAALRAALARARASAPQEVVLDFSRVGFCDSHLVSAIAPASQALAADGGSLRVANAPRTVRRLLELTGLDPLLAA